MKFLLLCVLVVVVFAVAAFVTVAVVIGVGDAVETVDAVVVAHGVTVVSSDLANSSLCSLAIFAIL